MHIATQTIRPFLFVFFVFFSLLFANVLFSEEIVLFSPPKDWVCASLKDRSEQVRIGFVGKGKNPFFHPSINLAIEEVDVSLKEYIQAVKKIHKRDPLMHIRDLGDSHCAMGNAHLLELTSKTPYGDARILQFLCLHKKKAYVLTAAFLKEETCALSSQILNSFHSLTMVEELTALLSKEEKETLEKKIQELKKSSPAEKKKAQERFQTFVLHSFENQGPYWQLLLLKQAFEIPKSRAID
jgi:hypothetical protein